MQFSEFSNFPKVTHLHDLTPKSESLLLAVQFSLVGIGGLGERFQDENGRLDAYGNERERRKGTMIRGTRP